MKEKKNRRIFWQAHRGGAFEAPQNTVDSALYGWSLGAIVEVDVRTTADGEIITLHNATLRDTAADVPADIADVPVSELNYADIAEYHVNRGFEARYPDSKVPRLADLFELMAGRPDRELYLDLKDVDLELLGDLIKKHDLAGQCVFCHCDAENCRVMKSHVDLRCMLWIGGTAEAIMERFSSALADDLDSLDQIQLHLNQSERRPEGEWSYDPTPVFLVEALEAATRAGLDLELFPWTMNKNDIFWMLDAGFTWFCTDYPAEFKRILSEWETLNEKKRA